MKQEIINRINQLTSQDEPFLFVINYQGEEAFIRRERGGRTRHHRRFNQERPEPGGRERRSR